MSKPYAARQQGLYNKIKVMANSYRFKILELTEREPLSITKLSSMLNLSYTKCADYARLLEKERLVTKTRQGKTVLVRSTVRLSDRQILFT